MSYGNPFVNPGYPDPTNYDDDNPQGPGSDGNPPPSSGFTCFLLITLEILGVCIIVLGLFSRNFISPDSFFIKYDLDAYAIGLGVLITILSSFGIAYPRL